ncbi:MAG: DNA ligase D [Ferruginibacter sp.]
MLAKETSQAFDSKDWIFEIKWDGYRAIAHTGKNVQLYSRNGNSFLEKYETLALELSKIKKEYVLDGEIVLLNEEGHPDFQKLQDYENFKNYPLLFYVFDILKIGNKATYDLPLIERKTLLKKIFLNGDIIRFSDHISNEGVSFFNAARDKNLEGIMAKKADSTYYPGKRTSDWLKIKNHKTVDVIIAGYTNPEGSRNYFGSLILGIKEGKNLNYIGNAGTGFNEDKLKEIYALLQPLKTTVHPFDVNPKLKDANWVKPKIICEVKFSEWTSDKKLRHPVFLHIRNDKNINEIKMKKVEPVKAVEEKKVNAKSSGASKKENKVLKFGKTEVIITHPNKVYFPKEKITKGDIVDYYQSIAKYILPYLKDRPESLNRTPNGIEQPGFFHKDAAENAPSWIKSFQVHSDSSNKEIDYIICNNAETLAYLNNLGCIELNPWHSSIKNPDNPDYLIIDLDPSDNNTFDQVIETALEFKKLFDKIKVDAYCKTSGASGLHVYVPMGKKYEYEQVKNFANILCSHIAEVLPNTTTLTRALKKRDPNKIYLDYLQNRKSQTIASVYCVRPKEGATVSMPVHWKEVKKGLKPSNFTIKNAQERIIEMGDIFIGVLGKGIDMKKALKLLTLNN